MATQTQTLINLYDALDVVVAIRDFRCNNCCETARDRMIVNSVCGDIAAELKSFANTIGARDYKPFDDSFHKFKLK